MINIEDILKAQETLNAQDIKGPYIIDVHDSVLEDWDAKGLIHREGNKGYIDTVKGRVELLHLPELA